MQNHSVRVESIKVYLTLSGYVALESDEIDPAIELDVFGADGLVPPVAYTDLVDTMIETTNAAPDKADAAELRTMAVGLKTSLEKVETQIARLEKRDG